MGTIRKLIFLLAAAGVGFLGIQIKKCFDYDPVPVFDEPWWGPGEPGVDNKKIQPFKISVSDEVLKDLNDRLTKVRPFTPPLEGAKQHYGFNTYLLQEILQFWKTKYNWREREVFLNQFPHFKTQIQGLDIHFMHIKPQVKKGIKVFPMLMLHGWPGSIREFYEIIPMLTNPRSDRDFVFELVIPSLPGFGFSQGAAKKGLGANQIAVIFKNLMSRLGYKKFYLQGGDWGGFIVASIAALFEDRILGIHSNFCTVTNALSWIKTVISCTVPSLIIENRDVERMCSLSKKIKNTLLESGYFHIQATKPDSIGVSLNESPIGLAAYVLEKFTTGTNPQYKDRDDGGLKLNFKYEDLLDNIMIYWVTNSMTTAIRIYAESISNEGLSKMKKVPIKVPAACAKFRHEIMYQPDWILKDKFINLMQSSTFDVGGHFAAMEVPKLLANDIWLAVEKFDTANIK